MKDRVVSGIFSFTGASVVIGAAGFLSALVTMFIDVTASVSVKWLLFVILVSMSLMMILLKIIYDVTCETKPPPPFEHPFRYIAEDNIFVIRRNDNFLNNIIVGCYLQREEVDKLAFLGVVHLVQDKVIQIKVHTNLGVLTSVPTSVDELKMIIVRPVVPVTALEALMPGE